MDIEKVFRDFNWHPNDGDYGKAPDDEAGKKSEKVITEKIFGNGRILHISVYLVLPFVITIIILGILILK